MLHSRDSRKYFLALAAALLLISGGLQAEPSERSVQVRGELQVMIGDDFDAGVSQTDFFIQDEVTRERFQLRFEDGVPPGLRSGNKITVRGRKAGKEIFLAAGGVDQSDVYTVAPTAVSGNQRTLVMVADFTDASVSCPVSQIRDLMFTDPGDGSVDDLYREMTFEGVSFTGNVVGPFAIPHSTSGSCDPFGWAESADAAARANGIEPNNYPRKVYVMPRNNACGWAGYGAVGGADTRSWVFRCGVADVYAHELGHNLGMGHAATPTSQYGDTSDIMGGSGFKLRHTNSVHKALMGWTPSGKIQTVTSGGNFALSPLELAPAEAANSQIIRIPVPGTTKSVYLSYRMRIGFDANLAYGYDRALTVHEIADASPSRLTTLLKILSDGESYLHEESGVTIKQLVASDNGVTLQINSSGQCAAGAPTINRSPATNSGAPGSTLNYTITVTNTDSAECAGDTFYLNTSVPASGWTASVDNNALQIAPGQSRQTVVRVTSPTGAAGGDYPVSVNVSGAGNAAHVAAAQLVYSVEAACTRWWPGLQATPTQRSGAPGSSRGYELIVTNLDSAACGATTYDLGAQVAEWGWGWSLSLSQTVFSLNPGQSRSITLTASAPASAPEYNYPIDVVVNGNAGYGNSRRLQYEVVAVTEPPPEPDPEPEPEPVADTEAPTVPGGLTGTAKRKQNSLAWFASSDNVGVTGYRVWREDVGVLAVVSETTYNDRSAATGTVYRYAVSAIDAAGNGSGRSAWVTVGSSSGTSKGKGGKR